MENLQSCFDCTGDGNELFLFSCTHSVCSLCLMSKFFKESCNQDQDKLSENIMLTCKCGKGNIEVSLNQISEMKLNHTEVESRVCTIHVKKLEKYCTVCLKWFCLDCINLHNGVLNLSHQMVDEEPIAVEKCKAHNKKLKFYCTQCKMEICQLCGNENSAHFGHSCIQLEKYIEHLKEHASVLLGKYKNYDELSLYLTKIDTSFKDKFNFIINETLGSLDEAIESIERKKAQFKAEMEGIYHNEELFMKSLRELYSFFYSEVSNKKKSIRLIKSLKKLNFILTEIPIKENELSQFELANLKKKIQDINNISKNIEIKFNVSFLQKEFQYNQTLTDHKGQVILLLQLEDGKMASGSWDNTIKIWDTDAKQIPSCVNTLVGHSEKILSLIQLRDGRIVSGALDNIIKIWDPKTFSCIQTLEDAHFNSVNSFCQLTSGKLLSGSGDNTIKVWNTLGPLTYLMTRTGHTNTVTSIVQLLDGKVASGSNDQNIKIWDECLFCIHTLQGHSRFVAALLVKKDGRLVSGSWDCSIKIWDPTLNFKCTMSIQAHENHVNTLYELRDDTLVSGSDDYTIKIWDIKESFTCLQILQGHEGWVNSIIQLNDGRIISGSSDKTIKIWELSYS